MALLTDADIEEKLKGLNGWEHKGGEITKLYKLKNYIESVGFVNKAALLAERADHHPDILLQYNKVTITLSTHSEGGITDKDINLAAEIQGVF